VVSAPQHPALTLSPARKWLITISVMLITVMQILDTSITNVALPHMQGSLSTSVEETSWVTLNAIAFLMMTNVTLGMVYWALAFPRFVRGFGQGFVFVPLQTLALFTVRMEHLSNATSAFNVVRNFGGSVGIAIATTLLARRSQMHQATIVEHANVFDGEMQRRVDQWTRHFLAHGADTFTAGRRAIAMLYRDAIGQAQVLAYIDAYMVLVVLFTGILFLRPWMQRVRADQTGPRKQEGDGRVEGLPAAASD
jgi:hypothetical protein